MENERPFGKPRLVVDNPNPGGERTRDWCHLTVHCEWNDQTEWWVGQIFAGREVYRTGLFTNLGAAYAETISEFYRIVPRAERV